MSQPTRKDDMTAIRKRILDTLFNANHSGKSEAIEAIIDSCENFAEFLETVSEICCEKAVHVQEDSLLTETWEKRARLIDEISDLIEFEVRTGITSLRTIAGKQIRSKYFFPLPKKE